MKKNQTVRQLFFMTVKTKKINKQFKKKLHNLKHMSIILIILNMSTKDFILFPQ